MEEGILQIVLAVVSLVLLVFALVATAKAIFHMYKTVTNVKGKYAPVLGALLLIMPGQFNEEGNLHRVKLLRLLPWLAVLYILLFGLKYFLGIGE